MSKGLDYSMWDHLGNWDEDTNAESSAKPWEPQLTAGASPCTTCGVAVTLGSSVLCVGCAKMSCLDCQNHHFCDVCHQPTCPACSVLLASQDASKDSAKRSSCANCNQHGLRDARARVAPPQLPTGELWLPSSAALSKRANRAKAKRDAAKPKELTAEEWREAEAKATAAAEALLEEDRVTQAASSKKAKKKKKKTRGEDAPVAETAAEATEAAEALQGIEISAEISDALDTASVLGTEQSADSAAPVPPALPDEQVLTLADLAVADLAGVTDCTGDIPESTIGGQTTCIVCFTGPKSHLAVPCGHQSVCVTCSAKMKQCPYCREPVQVWVLQRMV